MSGKGHIGVKPRLSKSDDSESSTVSYSFEGTKGVVGCHVVTDGFGLEKIMNECNPYNQLVQSFEFSSFQDLEDSMEAAKGGIEISDSKTLAALHERFRDVVGSIIRESGLYSEELKRYNTSIPFIRKYASPSVRAPQQHESSTPENASPAKLFANYLHNDAWFKKEVAIRDDDKDEKLTDTSQSNQQPMAMVNIWFI